MEEDSTIIQKYEKIFTEQINANHNTAIKEIFRI